MCRKRFVSPRTKAGEAGIGPHIAAIATVAPELDVVLMGRIADPKDPDQLVLAAIERALPRIDLIPDDNVQHQAIDLASNPHQGFDMPPVRANVVHRAITR